MVERPAVRSSGPFIQVFVGLYMRDTHILAFVRTGQPLLSFNLAIEYAKEERGKILKQVTVLLVCNSQSCTLRITNKATPDRKNRDKR